jgi:hypothetical protein
VTALERALQHLRSAQAELDGERPAEPCPSRFRLSQAIDDAKKSAAMVEIEIQLGGQS